MLIDLTHPFTDMMPTYPGDPASSLKRVASIGKEGYIDYKLETTMHVGTHIDAPAHMIEGGKRIDELPLELFHGEGVVVDARDKRSLDIEILRDVEIEEGHIVLFCTGFSKKYRAPEYFTDFPVMTEALALELVQRKVKMVGMDTPSPDLPAPSPSRQAGRVPFAVHKIFLGASILIAENLTNLEALLKIKAFDVEAIPMRIAADAAFARIMALPS